MPSFPPGGNPDASIVLSQNKPARLASPGPHMAGPNPITQPLALIRQLHASRLDNDDQEFGVKARFGNLLADPQQGAQASGGFEMSAASVGLEGRARPCTFCARPIGRQPASGAAGPPPALPAAALLPPLSLCGLIATSTFSHHKALSAAQVPVFVEETAEQLPNHCLVRFRGMVSERCGGLLGRRHGGLTHAPFPCLRARPACAHSCSKPPVLFLFAQSGG